jgi:hypothetical protein
VFDPVNDEPFLQYPGHLAFAFPAGVFIRPCYESLFTILEQAVKLREKGGGGVRRVLILGNPGIGKTYFKFYLCFVLVNSARRVILRNQYSEKIEYLMMHQGKVCLFHISLCIWIHSPDYSLPNNR